MSDKSLIEELKICIRQSDPVTRIAALIQRHEAAMKIEQPSQPEAKLTERQLAEVEYSCNAFDFERDPIGSKPWCDFWDGWQAARASQPVSEQAKLAVDETKFNATRLRMVCNLLGLGDAIPEEDDNLLACMGSVLGMVRCGIEELQSKLPTQGMSLGEAVMKEWCEKMAVLEQGHDIGAGCIEPSESAKFQVWCHNVYRLAKSMESLLSTAPVPPSQPTQEWQPTDEDIKRFVNRFLGWRIPKNFNPDAGITFNRAGTDYEKGYPWPTGTNLLDAKQATDMLKYIFAAQTHCGRLPIK